MNDFILQIKTELKKTEKVLKSDLCLSKDIDFTLDFIPPFSTAKNIENIKLVVIGQDPTVRNVNSRKDIKTTLNLDKSNSLKTYLEHVCQTLGVNLDEEVYATNLYKCFFHIPPADDETILTRHFKIWCDFLIREIEPFKNQIFITLGEPVLNQLIHSGNKKVSYYWNYIGETKSNLDFKYSKLNENYLQRKLYPIAHQPTWSRNEFYKKYLTDYLRFIKINENK